MCILFFVNIGILYPLSQYCVYRYTQKEAHTALLIMLLFHYRRYTSIYSGRCVLFILYPLGSCVVLLDVSARAGRILFCEFSLFARRVFHFNYYCFSWAMCRFVISTMPARSLGRPPPPLSLMVFHATDIKSPLPSPPSTLLSNPPCTSKTFSFVPSTRENNIISLLLLFPWAKITKKN